MCGGAFLLFDPGLTPTVGYSQRSERARAGTSMKIDAGDAQVSDGTTESNGFFKLRLAKSLKMVGAVSAVFLTARTVFPLAWGLALRDVFEQPSYLFHFTATALFLVSATLLSRGRLDRWTLVVADLAIFFTGSVLFIGMAASIPPEVRPEQVIIAILTIVMMSRATYVPSTMARTALLGALLLPPLAFATFLQASRVDVRYLQLLQELAGDTMAMPITRDMVAVGVTVSTSVWWLIISCVYSRSAGVEIGVRDRWKRGADLGPQALAPGSDALTRHISKLLSPRGAGVPTGSTCATNLMAV